MLLVGLARLDRDGQRFEFAHKIHQRLLLRLHPAAFFVLQLAGQKVVDPRADDKIRQQSFFQGAVEKTHDARRGNHGKNAFVVR